MKKSILGLIVLLLLAAASPSMAGIRVPFGPGEKLTYELTWTFISAGTAVLEMMPDTEVDGKRARYFKATAKTLPWVDKIFKVRDIVETWTDYDVTHSLRYKKDQNEGNYHKKVDLFFDKEMDMTFLWARGTLRKTMEQPKDVFDPMSILFSFRKEIFYKTMTHTANITDGKKTVQAVAYVEDVEKVETPAGVFRAFRVRMDIKDLSGIFNKSKKSELVVWFSADKRRIPVKVRSKVKVGHFTMELQNYRPPTASNS